MIDTASSVWFAPADCGSLGDLSRKLASAHGRDWRRITMGECDRWHGYTAALVAALYERDRENPKRHDLN